VTAKALTRKITRKQALSYRKTVPNRLGVTALAELNGPGAWQRRYDLTKQILSGKRVSGSARRNPESSGRGKEESAMANKKFTPGQRTAMAKMSPARRAAFKRMLSRSPDISTVRRNKKRAAGGKARGRAMRRNEAATSTKPRKKARTKAQKEATKRMQEAARAKRASRVSPTYVSPSMEQEYGAWAGPTASGVVITPGGIATKGRGRISKRQFLESKVVGEGKTYAQAEAMWKRRSGKKASKPRGPRTYARGKYKPLSVKLGKKTIPTYTYRAKRGRARKIPEFAILGYPSRTAVDLETRTERGKKRYDDRKAGLQYRRAKAVASRQKRILAGRDPFSPNAAEVMTWEEWKKMKPNKKKTTKKAAKKGRGRKPTRSPAQKAATRRMIAARKAKMKGKKGSKPRKPTAAKRRAAPKRRRKGTGQRGKALTIIMRPNEMGSFEANKKRARKKPAKKAGGKKRRTAAQKRATAALVAWNKSHAGKKRRGGAAKGKRGRGRTSMYMTLYSKNAMAGYEQNAVANWAEGLKEALKIGGIVVVGYAAHRALTKVLSDQVLGKLDAFKSGTLGAWRDAIAGLIVAAAGVPLAVKLIPGESAAAGAGMAASFLHGIIIKALTEAGQPEVASYLAAYPDASGPAYKLSGVGSYYTFRPHQLYPVSGMGEYITQSPNLRYNQLLQPAAGFGQDNGGAIVTQPAAGTGEYLVYGAEGVGDYSEVPIAPTPMSWDEGVLPTLDAAERALNVMEAAAGVGSSEIPAQVAVNPVDYARPIGDEPTGSRAGVFEGKGGIFG